MSVATTYLCHACGTELRVLVVGRWLYFDRCERRRRVPTHPALVMVKP